MPIPSATARPGRARPDQTAARVGSADLGRLRAIVRDTHPGTSVHDRLPVLEPLQPLLGGLRRGAVVSVDGGAGRTSLTMALLAGVSAAGGWCGVVGIPSWGCLAAKGYGVRLDRLALVPEPGAAWAEVVAALAAGLDAVLVQPPGPVPGRLARRLAAKARQSRCTLLTLGQAWEGCDIRVGVRSQEWVGLRAGHNTPREGVPGSGNSAPWEGTPQPGHGRLRGCRVTVVASTRPGTALDLWLPGEDGRVHAAETWPAFDRLPFDRLPFERSMFERPAFERPAFDRPAFERPPARRLGA